MHKKREKRKQRDKYENAKDRNNPDIVQKLNENWRQNQKEAEKENEINIENKKKEEKRIQRERQKEKTKILKEKMNTPIPHLPPQASLSV